MLCSRPTSLKQRAPNDLLPRHSRKPSREAGSFSGLSIGAENFDPLWSAPLRVDSIRQQI